MFRLGFWGKATLAEILLLNKGLRRRQAFIPLQISESCSYLIVADAIPACCLLGLRFEILNAELSNRKESLSLNNPGPIGQNSGNLTTPSHTLRGLQLGWEYAVNQEMALKRQLQWANIK